MRPVLTPLFAREVIHRDRVLEQRVIARHDRDAAIGDEVAFAIGFGIVANRRAFRNMHVAIDNGLLDAATASDVDVGEQNAVFDFRVRINPHIGG